MTEENKEPMEESVEAEGESLPEDVGGEESDAPTGETAEPAADADYEALAAADLEEIKQKFPAMRRLSHLCEIENAERYGQLRDAGLSVEEAFLATNYARLSRRAGDNRAHLAGSMPRSAAAPVGRMSYGELIAARELFDGLSDREIEALWKRTHS